MTRRLERDQRLIEPLPLPVGLSAAPIAGRSGVSSARPSRALLLQGRDRGAQQGVDPLRVVEHFSDIRIEHDDHYIPTNAARESVLPRLAVVEAMLPREVASGVALPTRNRCCSRSLRFHDVWADER